MNDGCPKRRNDTVHAAANFRMREETHPGGIRDGRENAGHEMARILPKDLICDLFSQNVAFSEYTLGDIEQIKKVKPNALSTLALSVLHRVIQFNLRPVDTASVSDRIGRRDPHTYTKVSEMLGEETVRDIYYVRGEIQDTSAGDRVVAELLSARIYPNNLHLSDITLSRPHKPRRMASQREIEIRHTALFHKLVFNAITYGKAKGCNYLLLKARSPEQADIFSRCGLLPEGPSEERWARKFGMGTPMMRLL